MRRKNPNSSYHITGDYVDEEYDLLRKFANYHYSSSVNAEATIDDLNIDYLKEYVAGISTREIMNNLSKIQMARSLHMLDKNDPTENII